MPIVESKPLSSTVQVCEFAGDIPVDPYESLARSWPSSALRCGIPPPVTLPLPANYDVAHEAAPGPAGPTHRRARGVTRDVGEVCDAK